MAAFQHPSTDIKMDTLLHDETRSERNMVQTCGSIPEMLCFFWELEPGLRQSPEHAAGIEFEAMVNDKKIFMEPIFFSNHQNVRRASYEMVIKIAAVKSENSTNLLINIAPLLFNSLNEEENQELLPLLWSSILSLVAAAPQAWEKIDVISFWSKISDIIENEDKAILSFFLKSLLPLLSLLPESLIETTTLISLFKSIWSRNMTDASSTVIESFAECFEYCIFKYKFDFHEFTNGVLLNTIINIEDFIRNSKKAIDSARMIDRIVSQLSKHLDTSAFVFSNNFASLIMEKWVDAFEIKNTSAIAALSELILEVHSIASCSSNSLYWDELATQLSGFLFSLSRKTIYHICLLGNDTNLVNIVYAVVLGYQIVINKSLISGAMCEEIIWSQVDVLSDLAQQPCFSGEQIENCCKLISCCFSCSSDTCAKIFYSVLDTVYDTAGYSSAALLIESIAHTNKCSDLSSDELDSFAIGLCPKLFHKEQLELLKMLYIGDKVSSFLSDNAILRCLEKLHQQMSLKGDIKLNVGSLSFVMVFISHSHVNPSKSFQSIKCFFDLSFKQIIEAHASEAIIAGSRHLDNELEVPSDDEVLVSCKQFWRQKKEIANFIRALDSIQQYELVESIVNKLRSLMYKDLNATVSGAYIFCECLDGNPELSRKFLLTLSNPNVMIRLFEKLCIRDLLTTLGHDKGSLVLISDIIDLSISEGSQFKCPFLMFVWEDKELLRKLLDLLRERGHFASVEELLDAAPESDGVWLAEYCANIFKNPILNTATYKTFVFHILNTLSKKLRADRNAFELSKLSILSTKLCIEGAECHPLSIDKADCISACFPVAKNYYHDVYPEIENISAGANVLYYRSEGIWESAVITSIDNSIVPPSFSISMANGVCRETEASRFILVNQITNIAANNISAHYFCSEDEKNALLALFRELVKQTETINGSVSRVFLSVVEYCSGMLSHHDCTLLFSWLDIRIRDVEAFFRRTVGQFSEVLLRECHALSGMKLEYNIEATLEFCRQIKRKGIFQKSKKGIDVLATLDSALYRTLGELDCYLEEAIIILQVHRKISWICIDYETGDDSSFLSPSDYGSIFLRVFLNFGFLVAMTDSCGLENRLKSLNMWRPFEIYLEQLVKTKHGLSEVAFDELEANASDGDLNCVDSLLCLSLRFPCTQFACSCLMEAHKISEKCLDFKVENEISIDRGEGIRSLQNSGMHPILAEAFSLSRVGDPSTLNAWIIFLSIIVHEKNSKDGIYSKLSMKIKEIEQVLKDNFTIVSTTLDFLANNLTEAILSKEKWQHQECSAFNGNAEFCSLKGFISEINSSYSTCAKGEDTASCFSLYRLIYVHMLYHFPILCRIWFAEIRDRKRSNAIQKMTYAYASKAIVGFELSSIQTASLDGIVLRILPNSRELLAKIEIEEGQNFELSIVLPECFPLLPPEINSKKSVGIPIPKLRKWLLAMEAFLRNRNGALLDSLRLWKQNVDKEFEGHQECLICYSIVQLTNGELPKLVCRTCAKKFHGKCLYKWFSSSGKNTCPHCQSQW